MTDEKHVILIDMEPAVGVRGVASYSLVDMYEKSDEAVGKAMGMIRAMAEKTFNTVKSIPASERPSKVEVEFGIKFNLEAGAVVAKASTETAIKVTLTWEHKDEAK
jgi:hypothetical protein